MNDKGKPFVDSTADAAPPPSFLEATSSAVGPSALGCLPPFQTRLACVSLNMTDRIRFINFSEEDIKTLRVGLDSIWRLQGERKYGGADEFKFREYPWVARHNGNDQSRRLVKKLLETLYDLGWVLQAAIDISKKHVDKDTLIFRYQNPPPPPCEWLSISFDGTDKLKIVDAPPLDLTQALVDGFRSAYGLKSYELESDRLKLKFHGQPWQAGGDETVQTRMLILTLLEILEKFGYSLYASIDQVSRSEGEADVLIVTRHKGWAPGMPIWHR